jgi:methyltransferase
VTGTAFILALIIGLMLAETRVSYAHERRLRGRGAVMPDGDVYRALAVLYPAAFLLMGLEGIWRASHAPPATMLQGPSWFLSGLLMFVASKALKYWAIASLGDRWTFRVLVLPGAPLVTRGPYRYVAHPNYIAVVGELVGTAMMMGARVTGPVMTALFGIALFARVRFENRVLGV